MVLTSLRNIVAVGKLEMRARFSGTLGGSFWTVFSPLLTASAICFAASTKFAQAEARWYAVLAAYLVWVILTEQLTDLSRSFVSRDFLIKKIRANFSLSPLFQSAILMRSHIFFIAIVAVLCVYYGESASIWLFLKLLFDLSLLILALSWFFATLTVFIKDLPNLLSTIFQLLFWVTPIVWPSPTAKVFSFLQFFPTTYLIVETKGIFAAYDISQSSHLAFYSFVVFMAVTSYATFQRLKNFFVDEL